MRRFAPLVRLSDSRAQAASAGKLRLGRAVAWSLGTMFVLLAATLSTVAVAKMRRLATSAHIDHERARIALLERQLDAAILLARRMLGDIARDPGLHAVLRAPSGAGRLPRHLLLYGQEHPLQVLDRDGWVREPDGSAPRVRFADSELPLATLAALPRDQGRLLFDQHTRPILRMCAPIGTGDTPLGALLADLDLVRLLPAALDPALFDGVPLEIRAGNRTVLQFGTADAALGPAQPLWRRELSVSFGPSAANGIPTGDDLAADFMLIALLATLGFVVLALGLAHRHVVRPLASLRSTVHAVVAGRLPEEPLAQTPLREIQELQSSMQRMARILADRENALRAEQQTLAARVEERTAQLRAMNSQLVATIQQKTATQALLVEARDAAVAASQAKTMFLANMSHEIRTPMNAILGFCEILLAEQPQCPELVEPVRTIQRNAQALVRLLNDILDVSKIEAGKLDLECLRFDLHELVHDVCSLHGLRAEEKEIRLSCELAPDLPRQIVTDPTRLRQVLINLIGNAIKFTDAGTIRVEVAWVPGDTDSGRVRFAITDTGIGLTQEQLARLFQPFTQADGSFTRRYGGTGLGLSISQSLVRLLGGDLQLTSAPARGTTCRFEIRAGLAGSDAGPGTPPQEHAPIPTGLHVLLAEDGRDNQRLLTHYLRQLAADITVVENGGAAIDAVHARLQQGRPFDLILMDIQMPQVDGHEATRRIRAAGHAGPILALTAHAMSGHREQCLASGCDGFLTKPVGREALLSAIAELLQRPQPA